MIQETHLTAWQVHAPWPRRSQVEQDLRLSRGVAAIFADPVLFDGSKPERLDGEVVVGGFSEGKKSGTAPISRGRWGQTGRPLEKWGQMAAALPDSTDRSRPTSFEDNDPVRILEPYRLPEEE